MQLSVDGDSLRIDDAQYQDWIATQEPLLIARRIDAWQRCRQHAPVISILLPTYDTDTDFLRAALDSVLSQLYPHWQLCIVDDASREPAVAPLLRHYAQRDARIHLHFQTENRGIAATTSRALEAATGEYIALLDHDDVLAPHALLSIAVAINECPQARLLYSDSDSLDAEGRRIEPFFKPGWNYDLVLGQNYINHLTVYRRQALLEAGGWRAGFEGSQDYDLLLRVIEMLRDDEIYHIPEILYHWRQVPTSVSRANLGAAVRAARAAIREHLQRSGQAASVKPCIGALLYNRIAWQPGAERAAIAIHGEDRAAVDRSVQQLQQLIPGLDASGVLLGDHSAGFQALNDWAARQSAPLLGFIAAGFELESADALSSLLGQAGRPGVAAVSARLVNSQGESRGPLLLAARPDGGATASVAYGAARQAGNTGYFASLVLDRQVAALQAGCLFAKTALFRAAGGWAHPLSNSLLAGIDLSLRLRAGGNRLVWNAQAVARSRSTALDAAMGSETSLDTPGERAADNPWHDGNLNKNLSP